MTTMHVYMTKNAFGFDYQMFSNGRVVGVYSDIPTLARAAKAEVKLNQGIGTDSAISFAAPCDIMCIVGSSPRQCMPLSDTGTNVTLFWNEFTRG